MYRLNSIHSRFRRDQNGTIAIMFGFALLVFCMLVGLGVDGGRTMVSRSRTAEALDAATLAATRVLMVGGMSDAKILELALTYFNKNIENGATLGVSYSEFHLDINPTTKTVTATVNAHVPTTFTAVTGTYTINYRTSAQATYNVNDIELGLVLDTTGSMNDPSKGGGGKSKIAELKVAAAEMFDILLPDTGATSDVRIGIAPFAASVNAGAYASDVTHILKPKDNCTSERQGTNAWTDADPMPNNEQLEPGSLQKNDLDPTEGTHTNAYSCPNAAVLPLTNDKDALKAEVNSFTANGWTAGHLGTQWGWYLVSPTWNSIWPAANAAKPYGTQNLIKAVVVMTDGIYNTAYHNGTTAAQQAINLCNNAKAQGVVVYTVGFTAPKGAESTLMACATLDERTGKPFYYRADSHQELSDAFKDIAVKLSLLRVSQ